MLTLSDHFCGAGGSSSGAKLVPGVEVKLALNHWDLALATHQTNHPEADHDKADLSIVDPRRYPRTNIGWFSPECTNHSQAKGLRKFDSQPDLFGETLPDEAAERSRSTMKDVLTFAAVHRYEGIIVENVIDVRNWQWWPTWVRELGLLGYDHEVVYLNSMHAQALGYGAPQSRDRLYVVAWLRGNRRPDLRRWTRPPAWCGICEQQVVPIQAWKKPDQAHGRFGAQYVWRCPNVRCRNAVVVPGVLPAAAAIDWSLPGERIGDRSRPLAPKTVARIKAGLAKYGRAIHLEAAGNTFERRPGVRAWPVTEPLRTVHATPSKAIAYEPLITPAGGTWNDTAQTVNEPMRTRTTRETDGLAIPPGFVMRNNTPRAGDSGGHLSTPFDEPLRAITTAGHQSVVTLPMVVPVEGRDGIGARSVLEPQRTQTARLQDALVVPLRQNGVARPADTDPLMTVAAAGNHHALVFDYNGPARPVTEPMPTQTTIEGNGLIGTEVEVEDCLFRMLQPHEIQLAMAFDPGYTVLGTRREQVRQLGNAVTPPAARDLIAALVEAITGELIA